MVSLSNHAVFAASAVSPDRDPVSSGQRCMPPASNPGCAAARRPLRDVGTRSLQHRRSPTRPAWHPTVEPATECRKSGVLPDPAGRSAGDCSSGTPNGGGGWCGFFGPFSSCSLNNTTPVPERLAGIALAEWVVTSSFRVLRDENCPTPTPGGDVGLPSRISQKTSTSRVRATSKRPM